MTAKVCNAIQLDMGMPQRGECEMSTERWICISYGYATILVGTLVLAFSSTLHIAVALLLAHMAIYMIVSILVGYKGWRPGPIPRVAIIVGDAAIAYFIVSNSFPAQFFGIFLACGVCSHMASTMFDIEVRQTLEKGN